jgi:hypothetical protein
MSSQSNQRNSNSTSTNGNGNREQNRTKGSSSHTAGKTNNKHRTNKNHSSRVTADEELPVMDYRGTRNAQFYEQCRKKFENYTLTNYTKELNQIFQQNGKYLKFGEAPEPKDVQQFSPENDPFGFKRTAFNEVIKAHMKKKKFSQNNHLSYLVPSKVNVPIGFGELSKKTNTSMNGSLRKTINACGFEYVTSISTMLPQMKM